MSETLLFGGVRVTWSALSHFRLWPLEFLGENGRQRYLDTYFADRSEIWTHGDLAEITETGGLIISGRTDTTLKPGGVRIGDR